MGDERVVNLSNSPKEPSRVSKMMSWQNMLLIISILLILTYFVTLPSSDATINGQAIAIESNAKKFVEVYYFYEGQNCATCIEGKAFLEGLRAKYPSVSLRVYETAFDPENKDLLSKYVADYSVQKPFIMPITFIESRAFKDFSNSIGAEMESYLRMLSSPSQ